jgi:putative DNA primase/helicase
VPTTLKNDIETSRIEWDSQPVTITANEALASAFSDPGRRDARADAEDFLLDVLADGPKVAKEVERIAKDTGHSQSTIRRAKKALGIIADKEGYQGVWRWSLPSKALKLSKGEQQEDVNTFESNERLWGADANLDIL